MSKNKHKKLFRCEFGYLFIYYKDSKCFWELCRLFLRTLILLCLDNFFAEGVIVFLVSLYGLAVYLNKPYLDDLKILFIGDKRITANQFENFNSVLVIMNYSLCSLIDDTGLGYFFLVLAALFNLGVFVFLGYLVIKNGKDKIKKILDTVNRKQKARYDEN